MVKSFKICGRPPPLDFPRLCKDQIGRTYASAQTTHSEMARLRAKLADGAIDAFSVRVSTLWRMFRDRAEF